MCKKLGITALVIVAALFTLHKLDLLGYGKMAWNKAKTNARNQIPPEVKIERLKQEIAQLEPNMREHRAAMAREQIEIETLQEKIAAAKESLERREAAIRSVKEKLDKGAEFVSTVSGRTIPREKVKADLANQWQTYNQAKETIKAQEDLLEQRVHNLELAHQKAAQLKSKKAELEVTVARLENELRKVRMAQTKSNLPSDNSQLDRVLQLSEEIDRQIREEKVKLELEKADLVESDVVRTEAERQKVEKALKEMEDSFSKTKVAERKK